MSDQIAPFQGLTDDEADFLGHKIYQVATEATAELIHQREQAQLRAGYEAERNELLRRSPESREAMLHLRATWRQRGLEI